MKSGTLPRQRCGRGGAGRQGGSVPVVWPALTLSEGMRRQLRVAVRALLSAPGLVGAPDSVRVAARVLMAKTCWKDLEVLLTAGELARWLGLRPRTVKSEIRRRLQRGGVASVDVEAEPPPGAEQGRTLGIRWVV